MLLKKLAVMLLPALAMAAGVASKAQAGIELVTNGNFESTTGGPDKQIDFNTTLTGWASPGGYNFLFAPGSADTTGAVGQFGGLTLWGPGSGGGGVANGLTPTSPVGGNFVAADGAFNVAAISQTINGLTVGEDYVVSFYWAAAQQYTFDGDTDDKWQVSFGAQTISTATVYIPSHGFAPWRQESFTYKATSTSQLLSFLAVGHPNGVPPFALLDGVSVLSLSVPEPATISMMVVGMIGLGAARRRRLAKSATV